MVGGRTDDLVHRVYSPWSREPELHSDRGWICPRCSKALAPWVRECNCTQDSWHYPETTDGFLKSGTVTMGISDQTPWVFLGGEPRAWTP